jgi:hypothetical protein
MSTRAKAIADRFVAFNQEVIAFVENCAEENWRKNCAGENWPVAVVAHHIAAGHYGILDFAKMILAGEKLPEITEEAMNQMNADHAKEHANCTKDEVLGLLRENGPTIADFVSGLSDEELDRTGYLALAGGDISIEQFLEGALIQSSGEHVSNMKAAVGV